MVTYVVIRRVSGHDHVVPSSDIHLHVTRLPSSAADISIWAVWLRCNIGAAVCMFLYAVVDTHRRYLQHRTTDQLFSDNGLSLRFHTMF
jgi:hypothetical protein